MGAGQTPHTQVTLGKDRLQPSVTNRWEKTKAPLDAQSTHIDERSWGPFTTHTHKHTHTRTHAQTHSTHIHTDTHTHTHTQHARNLSTMTDADTGHRYTNTHAHKRTHALKPMMLNLS